MTRSVFSTAPADGAGTGVSCPACLSPLRYWFTKRANSGAYPVHRCPGCRSAFVMPRPSAAEIAAIYTTAGSAEYEACPSCPRECSADDPRHQPAILEARRIAARIKALTPGRDALDVGGGSGFQSRELIRAGFTVEALEPNALSRYYFRQLNGFEPIDAFLDGQYVESHGERFDAVLLSQVLEHLIDPDETAEHLRRLLRPGGVAAIAVPQFRSWLSLLAGRRDPFISPPEHLNFFTLPGLESRLERHGFVLSASDSTTWFDPDRVARRMPWRPVGRALVVGLHCFFKAADCCHGGNTLKAYFRRRDDVGR